MTESVVSILTARLDCQLAEVNARLECRIQELEAEVAHQKALVHSARQEVADANFALKQEREKGRGW